MWLSHHQKTEKSLTQNIQVEDHLCLSATIFIAPNQEIVAIKVIYFHSDLSTTSLTHLLDFQISQLKICLYYIISKIAGAAKLSSKSFFKAQSG